MSDHDDADRRQRALLQAGLILASELSLPAVLQKIIDLACDVADARFGALGVLGPDGTILAEFITYGVTEEERRAIGALPEGHGILGVLISEAQPLRLERIQDDPRSVGFPPNHPTMVSFLGVPVTVRGSVFGNLYLTEKRGAPAFTEEDEAAVLTLATQAAVAIENARLYQDARKQQQRLAAVNEITRSILAGEDVNAVLAAIARRARELAGAALATIATPDDPDHLVLGVAEGAHADQMRGMRFAVAESVSGEVMRTRTPVILADAAEDPRAHQPVVEIGSIGPAMLVPLAGHDRTFGTLAVANPRGHPPFNAEDLAVVQLFATQAAVALEYARVRGELERLAVIEDRERIAKELHDGVVQSLFAVGMALQATEAVAEDPALVRTRLGSAVDGIDGAIRDLRNYIFALRPGELADWQLVRRLRDLGDAFRAGTDAAIDVAVEPAAAARLAAKAADVEQAAREALSNAVRHAAPSRVSLSLRLDEDGATLTVRDDGSGFDPDEAAGRGHGLTNLRARAESLGGALTIDTDPGGGSTITIKIPL